MKAQTLNTFMPVLSEPLGLIALFSTLFTSRLRAIPVDSERPAYEQLRGHAGVDRRLELRS